MIAAPPTDAWHRVTVTDPACCDRDELAALVSDVQRVQSYLDARNACIALRAAEMARDGRCEPAVELLADSGRRTAADARAVSRRAGVCDRIPDLHDALADGRVTAGHLDAVARTTRGLNDAERRQFDDHADMLVTTAASMPVAEFERQCRAIARDVSTDDGVSDHERLRSQRTVTRSRDDDTGMCVTRITLDPVTDERMWTVVTRAVHRHVATGRDVGRSWEHTVVDTFVELVTGGDTTKVAPPALPRLATAGTLFHGIAGTEPETTPAPAATGPPSGRRVAEVSILIDWTALRDAATDAGIVCETVGGVPLPVATVRRLCCDADLYPTVLGASGELLDHGRATRLATPGQRRALAAMYATCSYPGCSVCFADCQVHHVIDWTLHHGSTDLANLTPLCAVHHHLAHEGGWTLNLQADRTTTWTRPDGTIHHHGPSPNRRPRAA